MLNAADIIESNPGLGPPPPFQFPYLTQLDDVDGLPSSWLLES